MEEKKYRVVVGLVGAPWILEIEDVPERTLEASLKAFAEPDSRGLVVASTHRIVVVPREQVRSIEAGVTL